MQLMSFITHNFSSLHPPIEIYLKTFKIIDNQLNKQSVVSVKIAIIPGDKSDKYNVILCHLMSYFVKFIFV